MHLPRMLLISSFSSAVHAPEYQGPRKKPTAATISAKIRRYHPRQTTREREMRKAWVRAGGEWATTRRRS